jgi:hypothetical protein
MCGSIKAAVFAVFGERMLPPINTNAMPEEIQNWKGGSSVKNCYAKLFKQINPGENLFLIL